MKRNLILVFLLLFLCGGQAFAGNPLAKEGYVGNVSLSVVPRPGLVGVDITTSHGYSFGNGLWMGGGVGASITFESDGILLPFFAEAKYSFMPDRKASPFIDCRVGYMTNFEATYLFFSPMAGVDINRFSVFVQFYTKWAVAPILSMGAAFNF
ncbi:MAG: hypothetical protein IKT11_01945 [Bacteroidales bacterium]|nr:hypothetical protein [Bacteroidales bacterium]